MSDTDQSLYNIRYNQITQGMEGFGGGTPQWTPLVLTADGGINQLTGQVTAGPGVGSQVATIANSAVIGKVLTGYVSGAGTVAATDTILQAVNKLNGNDALKLPIASFTDTAVTSKLLTGYSSGAGTVASTDTILQGINKLNGNSVAISAVANAALPASSATVLTLNANSAGSIGAFSDAFIIQSHAVTAIRMFGNGQTEFVQVANFDKAPLYNLGTTATTGTITPDATTGPTIFIGTVTGAITLNGPSGGYASQKLTLVIKNDASHSVTLATGAGNFRFGTDIPSYTNSVSKTDYIGVIFNADGAGFWDVVSIIQGF